MRPYTVMKSLCFLIRAEDSINRRAANSALPLKGWFTIFHGYFLRILHLSLCFAFDTVVLISHGEVVSLRLLLHSKKHLPSHHWDVLHATGTLHIPVLAAVSVPAGPD